jgi:hypothetical protein
MAKTIEELRKMIGTVAGQATGQPAQPPAPAVPKLDAQGQPIVEPPPVMRFVEKEDELDNMLKNVDNFNEGMTKIMRTGTEEILRAIPHLVNNLATQVVTQKMAVAEFYGANPDLAAYKPFVGMVANEIAAKNPGWGMEDVVKNLGTEVRAKLKLAGTPAASGAPAVPQAPQAPVGPPPAFVPGGGARPSGGAPTLTDMEKGIAELLQGVQL